MMWYDNEYCCDDCQYRLYSSFDNCYICDLTSEHIELQDEACEEFVPEY